jgi:hypothetical protein
MNSTIAILLLRIVEFAESLSSLPCSAIADSDSEAADDVAAGVAVALLSCCTKTTIEPRSTTMSTDDISEAYGSRNKAKSCNKCDDSENFFQYEGIKVVHTFTPTSIAYSRKQKDESSSPLRIIHEGVRGQHISTVEKTLLSPSDLIHVHDHDITILYRSSLAC